MRLAHSFALVATSLLLACQPQAAPVPSGPPTPMPSPGFVEGKPPVPLIGAFLFYDDFEKDMARWTVDGATDGVGWGRLNAFTCGGAYTMLLGKGKQESFSNVTGASGLALREPVDLSGAKRPFLTFDVRGALTPEDAVSIQPEVSRDGVSWEALGTPTVGRYRFASTRWAELTPYAGGPLHLRFRASFTVGGDPITGMLLDDVRIIEPNQPG